MQEKTKSLTQIRLVAAQQEAMKTPSSSSSEKSSSAATMGADSCYYPGCRKDANCNCEMCLDSINATLDLMPISVQKSSLTKLSASRPKIERTPVSFDPSLMSTPTSNTCHQIIESPLLKSTARMSLNLQEKMEESLETEKKKKNRDYPASAFGGNLLRATLVLILIFSAGFGISRTLSGAFKPILSPAAVRRIGENSRAMRDLNRRLSFFQRELHGYVGHEKVSNCSYADSKWKVDLDGLLLTSHCTLYKSAMEEVSIWGWPLQTAGLLTTGFSSRSFTVLSGRVTEWADGKAGYAIRKANASWVHRNWGASAVQLDPNTWVLEYRRSLILEKSSLYSVVMELLKFRVSSVIKKMKQELWLLSALETQFTYFTPKNDIMIPT